MKLLSGIRPRTLILSVTPVLIGGAAAISDIESRFRESRACPGPGCHVGHGFWLPYVPSAFLFVWLLCLLVALFLQIAANLANDYSDGVRGTDRARTDSSATSSGTSPAAPTRLVSSGTDPSSVLVAAIVFAALACEAGLVLTFATSHWWFLIVGILCLLAGWFYVGGKHPYGYRGLGDLAVFLFFGLVATLGTQYALTSCITAMGICGAISAGLSACAVLGVNNLRDADTDRQAGKNTLVVLLGRQAGSIIVAAEALLSAVLLGVTTVLQSSATGICATLLALSSAALLVSDTMLPHDERDYRLMFRHATFLSLVLAVGYFLCTLEF
ncbi:1,4-dihydroxy-2-naphthoate octaprenyltransferase [Pseudoscardovia radai]|uniref:1,4-dihydroxy-2-naphthoate octaprenyltransferase n=1 Tax=Pseudoscardovia radai TaxID=987066 RepID=A0A261EZ47_9BIFI|nr:1,4-dihydroxy-2-naphthoate octaprenyltransferase [Pseudoscardovia radai]OZG52134.1 1,4-dihydroxy-2-naphthoate octaprenyltransferase [Pseudoscardovia radai]